MNDQPDPTYPLPETAELEAIDPCDLSAVVGGDANSTNVAKADVGLKVDQAGLVIGATLEERKNDYRSCLDAIGKYGGKVSECNDIHEKKP
ncbi:MAG: hypothetical protein AB7P03_19925 [Kofleriaceae bacterium]